MVLVYFIAQIWCERVLLGSHDVTLQHQTSA